MEFGKRSAWLATWTTTPGAHPALVPRTANSMGGNPRLVRRNRQRFVCRSAARPVLITWRDALPYQDPLTTLLVEQRLTRWHRLRSSTLRSGFSTWYRWTTNAALVRARKEDTYATLRHLRGLTWTQPELRYNRTQIARMLTRKNRNRRPEACLIFVRRSRFATTCPTTWTYCGRPRPTLQRPLLRRRRSLPIRVALYPCARVGGRKRLARDASLALSAENPLGRRLLRTRPPYRREAHRDRLRCIQLRHVRAIGRLTSSRWGTTERISKHL